MTTVSIIIINYNGEKDTLECLESLEAIDRKGLTVNVVVVDNGSKAKLPSFAEATKGRADFEDREIDIKVLRSEENLGFTGGNNLGIRYAMEHDSPDYILLLNNDTTVDKDFLVKLIEFAKSKDDVGVVCPMIYFSPGREFHAKNYTNDEQGKVVWFAGGSIDWKNMYAFHRGVDEVDRGQFKINSKFPSSLKLRRPGKNPKSKINKKKGDSNLKSLRNDTWTMPLIDYSTMDFGTGCCMLIPTKVIEKVGMFDESYFLYWEDVDLSVRIKQGGYELYFCAESVIWHKNAGSTGGSGSDFHRRYQERNRFKFAMKYAPWRTKIAVIKQKLTS